MPDQLIGHPPPPRPNLVPRRRHVKLDAKGRDRSCCPTYRNALPESVQDQDLGGGVSPT